MEIITIEQLIKTCFPICEVHPNFPNEFLELATGDEKAVFKKFQEKLFLLSRFKYPPIKTKWFERLKHQKNNDIYSLHIKTNHKNIRVLLSWKENGILYLHPFYERAGKNNTSYKPHIEIAINRRDDSTWRNR